MSDSPNPSVPSVAIPPGTKGAIRSGTAFIQSETATTGPELEAAFDHACLAAILPGSQGRTVGGGRDLARAIVQKMHEVAKKDPKLKGLVEKEYQVYLNNL